MPMYTSLSASCTSSVTSMEKVYSLPSCSTTAVTVTVMTFAASGVYWKGISSVPLAGIV